MHTNEPHSDDLIARLTAGSDRMRNYCFDQFGSIGQGHVGGTMSILDIVAALYLHHMRFDPENVDWPKRDRMVISKAHAAEAIYAALVETGVYPKELCCTYYGYESPFQGHADRWCTKGVDYSGGSLGQGLSFAAGLALAEKIETRLFPAERGVDWDFIPRFFVKLSPTYHTYCIVGDGELDEGQNWEAALFAPRHKLDNLTLIIDYNKWQLDGPTAEVLPIDPLRQKWEAFGWYVLEIDGHNMRQILDALDMTDRMYGDNRPKCIIAHTIKGYGVPEWEEPRTHIARGPVMAAGLEQGRAKYGNVQ